MLPFSSPWSYPAGAFLLTACLLQACSSEAKPDLPSEAPEGETNSATQEENPAEAGKNPAGNIPVTLPSSNAPVLPAIQAQARVIYIGAPEDPHTLQVTLAQGGYSRTRLASNDPTAGRRILYHASPEASFLTEAQSQVSQVVPEAESADVRLRSALREGLYGWQQNSAWQLDPNSPGLRHLALPGLGSLHARIPDNDSLPESMEARDPEGKLVERLEQIQWNRPTPASGLPASPSSLVRAIESGPVWTEDQIQVRGGLNLQVDFFRPADRRDQGPQGQQDQ